MPGFPYTAKLRFHDYHETRHRVTNHGRIPLRSKAVLAKHQFRAPVRHRAQEPRTDSQTGTYRRLTDITVIPQATTSPTSNFQLHTRSPECGAFRWNPWHPNLPSSRQAEPYSGRGRPGPTAVNQGLPMAVSRSLVLLG